jgi:hypothetical protein
MTHTKHPAPHTTHENRAHRAAPGSPPRARTQLVTDAVVASYIRDISQRAARRARTPRASSST